MNMKNPTLECNKCKTLYDYLKTIKEDFGFDISCLNGDKYCWGNKEDIDRLFRDNLKNIKGKDIVKIDYSDIAQVSWYSFTINYMNINDKRNGIIYDKRLKEMEND